MSANEMAGRRPYEQAGAAASEQEWDVLLTVSQDVSYRVTALTRDDAERKARERANVEHPFRDIHSPFASPRRKQAEAGS